MKLSEIDMQTNNWMSTLSANDIDVSTIYTENALLFSEMDNCIKGITNITIFYQNIFKGLTLNEYNSLYRVQLSENKHMVFEIGLLTTEQNVSYQYLILWTKIKGLWLRDLEAVAKKAIALDIGSGIDLARNLWVELANMHSAITLVKSTYIENFFYYNRGILYQGYENLADVYSYMNDLTFDIKLKSEYCVMVGQNLAYDIGVWNSSDYEGHYIIIWKRMGQEWKIMLDCNW
jgi:hypothetical protein